MTQVDLETIRHGAGERIGSDQTGFEMHDGHASVDDCVEAERDLLLVVKELERVCAYAEELRRGLQQVVDVGDLAAVRVAESALITAGQQSGTVTE